jgi:hypothetical protein
MCSLATFASTLAFAAALPLLGFHLLEQLPVFVLLPCHG